MRSRHLFAACAVVIAAALVFGVINRSEAQNSPAALTGMVSLQQEPQMEGVMVSAKRAGSTVTVTVATDAQGRYAYPRNRLEPGSYSMGIRAVGYELEAPASVQVSAQQTSQLDLKLRKTGDLASQLSNGEWFLSWPGSVEMKNGLLNCTQCHSLQLIARSRYTAKEWIAVLDRMGRYSQGSMPGRPQLRPGRTSGSPILAQSMDGREGAPPVREELLAKTAEYLATINLSSSSTWSYPLKTYPRPTGKSTQVVVTEYDLPRPEAMPHDAAADANGMIWYADFGSQVIGMLNPKTGEVADYQMPITKPGAPLGSLDLVFDKQGDIWVGTMYQGSLAKFDVSTKKFQTWGSPTYRDRDEARIAMVMPVNHDVDGQVWIGGDNEYQVDVRTGEWKAIDYSVGLPKDSKIIRELSSYGVASDSKNNFYGLNLNGTYIIRVDAKTKTVTPFPTPTPNAGPRRGHMDAQDRLWFAEFRGNMIGMFDTRTEKFQEFAVATPWTNVYDAIGDTAGYAWAGGMNNDRIVRVNTKTGETVEYLLPRPTNIRRVNVDNTTSRPTFWVGNNLGATIIKVEALD